MQTQTMRGDGGALLPARPNRSKRDFRKSRRKVGKLFNRKRYTSESLPGGHISLQALLVSSRARESPPCVCESVGQTHAQEDSLKNLPPQMLDSLLAILEHLIFQKFCELFVRPRCFTDLCLIEYMSTADCFLPRSDVLRDWAYLSFSCTFCPRKFIGIFLQFRRKRSDLQASPFGKC